MFLVNFFPYNLIACIAWAFFRFLFVALEYNFSYSFRSSIPLLPQ